MHLREVTESDLDELFELYSIVQNVHVEAQPANFRPPEKDELFVAEYEPVFGSDNDHLIVADAGECLAGYIRFSVIQRPKRLYAYPFAYGVIEEISVRPEQRRKGCASKLITYVKDFAKREGLASVQLDHWVFNETARKCFESHGFVAQRSRMSVDL